MISNHFSHSASNFFSLNPIKEGCFYFKRWMRYKVLWLSYTVSKSTLLTYSTLVVSNLAFYQLAFKIARTVYRFFPAPDQLTETQKVYKDLSVFTTWIAFYTISNIGMSKLLDLPVAATVHTIFSSIVFAASIYFKL